MNTTQLSATLKLNHDRTGKQMSKAKLLELFALSCGYCMAMRHAGRKIGDPEMNDAVYGNMEIQRVLLEVHSYRCPAWWHETIN